MDGKRRRILIDLLRAFLDEDGPGFPETARFRLAHEATRSQIDALVESRHIAVTRTGGYRLTIAGVQACANEDSSGVLLECNRLIEALRQCYREDHRRRWKAVDLSRRTKLSETAVARRLLLLSDSRFIGGSNYDEQGAISEVDLVESVLDAELIENPSVGPVRAKMRIERLAFEDFRGFAKADIQFDDRLTLLIGVNGAGKTAVLDAASVVLKRVHERVAGLSLSNPALLERDIRHGASWASVEGTVSIDDQLFNVRRVVGRSSLPPPPLKNLFSGKAVVERLQEQNEEGPLRLPLGIKYPVTRAALHPPLRVRSKPPSGAKGAYTDALSDKAISFRHFFASFRLLQEAENLDQAQGRSGLNRGLSAIRRAIESMVPGLNNIRIEVRPRMRMMAKKGRTSLEIDSLSDGERCMLALAGDLAWRLASAFPMEKDPLACPAVVMIDEVDLHLHPRWQRDVVRGLLTTFPGCQFIITTHSPQVLGSISEGRAYRLDAFEVHDQPLLYGYSSNYVLAFAMEAAERQQDLSTEIDEIGRMLERNDQLPAAKSRLEALREKLPTDPDVVRLLTMAKFLED